MDTGVIGPVLIIALVGGIYYYFNKVDADKNKKDADVYVQKTIADTEVEKLKIQQKELDLKREFFEFEREKLKPRLTNTMETSFKVIEDKSAPEE
jgi:hypothetical protein